ncbi:glutathione S-transferase U24-like [Dendrobium catenatum]|uniref:Probable glutathione S-transferase GSTU1 n=1 Tax=Dendrobium catenatum TaxID=906689 RepID=A0A2I0W7D3_9ASPA|nr:glutathione S-transferase U24-like [Dendrobium catenatum]PKU71562.1 Glutathione S-transferase U24 [Dendrobium catenatum]
MAVPEKGVKLLDFWMSPFGQRCRIALAEKEVEYEHKLEDLSKKSDLLLKSNPVHKKIPVLIHNGKSICESLIIVEYIDEVFPGKTNILPSDPYARSHARFWADFVDKKVYDSGSKLLKSKGKELEEANKELIGIFKTLETELGEKKYFGDDAFGLVDIAFAPFTSWFYTFEAFGGFSVEKECPKLAAWGKRIKERESVAKSLHEPTKVYDLFCEIRKKFVDA